MRKNFGSKPWLFPMPVLVIGTYNEDGTVNAMTAAWGMICDYDKLMLCLAQNHKTVTNILQRRAFTVSIADEKNIVQADFVGIVSGNTDPAKLKKTDWTFTGSQLVDAPMFDQLPMTLECRLVSFDEESECVVGEIVNVSADEAILTDDKIDTAKLRAITYDPIHNDYYVITEKAGKAFGVGLQLK